MYYHSQNLKKEEKGHLVNWRCWIGDSDKTQLTFAITIPSRFWHIDLDLIGYDESLQFSIACPLFAIWIGIDNRWLTQKLQKITKRSDQSYSNGRTLGVRYHDGTFWFSLWEDPMEWRSKDPKWWKFNFNPVNFFFGRQKHSEKILQEGGVKITMPEGVYEATFKRFISTWKRPRYPFAQSLHRISIDIPVGIPHEGKGENSWDCGMDATFGSTFPIEEHDSIYKIAKEFAIKELVTRQRYGSLDSSEYLKWKLEGELRLAIKGNREEVERVSGVPTGLMGSPVNSTASEIKLSNE